MRGMLCLAAVAIASLAAAVPASAAGGRSVVSLASPETSGEFHLRASNGYSVYVTAFGNEVILQMTGEHGSAAYSVHGHASARRIVARFGNRGRLDVRFRQTGGYRLHRPPKRCEGRARVTRFGVFTGTIKFSGEHGYATVDAGRAAGSAYVEPHWKCKHHGKGKFVPKSEGGREAEKPTILEAKARDHRISFAAISSLEEIFGGPAFFAQVGERRGRMVVSRSAVVIGTGAKCFEFDEGLTSATVRPPPPFSGSATFSHGSGDSTSWTGDLRVALPGEPHLALSGKRFDVSLQQSPFFRPQALGWNGS